jgi:hypothetical protein
MTIPITFQKQLSSDAPLGKAMTDCNQITLRDGRLELAVQGVKQKRQSAADFLGIMAALENVVGGCCIRTTTSTGFRAAVELSG